MGDDEEVLRRASDVIERLIGDKHIQLGEALPAEFLEHAVEEPRIMALPGRALGSVHKDSVDIRRLRVARRLHLIAAGFMVVIEVLLLLPGTRSTRA